MSEFTPERIAKDRQQYLDVNTPLKATLYRNLASNNYQSALSEIERLQKENFQMLKDIQKTNVECLDYLEKSSALRELVGEFERVSGELTRFGWHAVSCVKRSPHAAARDICDCGWMDAVREHRALIKKAQEVGKCCRNLS